MRKDGLPKVLGPMIPLIKSRDADALRLCLTLLTLGRAYTLPASPNYSTMTDPVKSTIGFRAIEDFIKSNHNRISWNPPVWKEFHLSTKAGPNGVATLSCIKDLHALTEEMIEDLSTLTGGEIDEYIEALRPDDISDKFIHSRISLKEDLEGKTRPFAIVDYWTQTALKPLHDELFNVLSRIPEDCTFSQASK